MITTRNVILDGVDVECEIHYSISNDSIGSYEYWGAKYYDYQPDYIEVEDIVPVDDFLREKYKDFIDENWSELENTVAVEMTDDGVMDDGDDWNNEPEAWEGGFADNH